MTYNDNILYKSHPEPLSGYKFMVFINYVPLGFTKISNREIITEFETLQEGGKNDSLHYLYKPYSTEKTLVLERGEVSRGIATSLLVKLSPGTRIEHDIIILGYNRNTTISKVYFVSGCVVKKWSANDFDAMDSKVMVEKFEINYANFEEKLVATMGAAGLNQVTSAIGFDPFSII